jgi:AcrR family transcriptional regulator
MAQSDPATRLADAALKLLGKTRWSELTVAQVARAAKVPLASLQTIAPDKVALFGLILRRIGADVAKTYHPDRRSADARDRLLDVALTWFEVLKPRAKAVRSLTEDLRRDPLSVIAARGEIVAAASWLLTLAEADTGASLPARALAFAGILARAIPVWLDDDDEMTATMARLDGDLRRGGFLFGKNGN